MSNSSPYSPWCRAVAVSNSFGSTDCGWLEQLSGSQRIHGADMSRWQPGSMGLTEAHSLRVPGCTITDSAWRLGSEDWFVRVVPQQGALSIFVVSTQEMKETHPLEDDGAFVQKNSALGNGVLRWTKRCFSAGRELFSEGALACSRVVANTADLLCRLPIGLVLQDAGRRVDMYHSTLPHKTIIEGGNHGVISSAKSCSAKRDDW